MSLSAEQLEWAARMLADHRPIEFVASVLELSEKKTQRAVDRFNEQQRRHAAVRKARVELGLPANERPAKAPLDVQALLDDLPDIHRKRALRKYCAKHWDAIWRQRAHGMSGKTIRAIYGDAALIYAAGGGVDVTI